MTTDAPAELGNILAMLATASTITDEDGNPKPLAEGTFAMYGMPDGGAMFVSSITGGPMAGTHHHRVPPGLIRAAVALMGQPGGKLKALKGLFGRGGGNG